jgi:dipeptidyl aminopeptidase/acylaminoacyl peptidase
MSNPKRHIALAAAFVLIGIILLACDLTSLVGQLPATPMPIPTPLVIPTIGPAIPAPPGAAFGPITFAAEVSNDKPVNPTTTFPAGTTKIYAFFDFQGMSNGLDWTRVWLAQGNEIGRNTEKWAGGQQGTWWVGITNESGFVTGSYELRLYVGTQLLQIGTFTISPTAALPPTVAPATTAPGATVVPPTSLPPATSPAQPTTKPAPTKTPSGPTGRGKVAYTVVQGPNFNTTDYQVWLMNADGSNPHRLATTAGMPAISPDGSRIVFFGQEGPERPEGNGMYIMNVDGSGQRRLFNDGQMRHPSWSSDGKRVVYQTQAGSGPFELSIVDTSASDPSASRTTFVPGQRPSWSPTGDKIAYDSCNGSCGIYVSDLGGTKTQITTDSGGAPSWSPDGKKLAYYSNSEGNFEIYVVNADGSGKVRLTNNPTNDVLPVWLPDGSGILFRSDRDGRWSIFVMGPDGSNPRRLVDAQVNPNRWEWDILSVSK